MLSASATEKSGMPLRHRSSVCILQPLEFDRNLALEEETPLFAADYDFAWTHGGPITRAFLQTLNHDPSQPMIIDSSLVWLVPGIAHGFGIGGGRLRSPVRFIHEPFPGATSGFRNESNRNFNATTYLCVLGLSNTPEVAEGELVFLSHEESEAFWLPAENVDARESEIERRMADGTLTAKALPLATIVKLGWGALRRVRPATESGFQFVIRATIGDRRPVVNGRRNLAIL